MAAEGDGRLTPDVRCVVISPQGKTLTAQEMQYAREAAALGALTVLCPGDMSPEAAEDCYGAQMAGAYRIIPGADALQGALRLCERERIPQEAVLHVCDGAAHRLPPAERPHRSAVARVRGALGRVKRAIRWRAMAASELMHVSPAEKRRLVAACKQADKGGRRFLVVSQMAAFDKGSCAYLKQLQALLSQDSFFHLSETPAVPRSVLEEKLSGAYHCARWAAFPAVHPPRVTGRVPEARKQSASQAVRDAALNLSLRMPELGEEGALALSLYLEELFSLAMDAFRPQLVMMWNAFTASHMILTAVAKARNIPVMFMEFGVLPGTMGFDLRGQMGQSALAHETLLPMPQNALDEAARVIDYLAHRRMNRNAQHADEPGSAVHLPRTGKRVVTFIGQNDYESGICPYDDTARQEHSPWYGSSLEALRALVPVCQALDCQLVYRPHPSMRVNAADVPAGVVLSCGGDLFSLLEKSDLTVTLMSQVGYEALLHGRTVLMLGRCQLTGKGCAWERGREESLLDAVSKALDGGYTENMKQAFRTHVAHVLRDYAYDDLSAREMRYGRQPHEWLSLLAEALAP